MGETKVKDIINPETIKLTGDIAGQLIRETGNLALAAQDRKLQGIKEENRHQETAIQEQNHIHLEKLKEENKKALELKKLESTEYLPALFLQF
jgi:hypothetical protein